MARLAYVENPENEYSAFWFYNIEKQVSPRNGTRSTDVMLIQFLLRQYFLTVSPSPEAKNGFNAIYESDTKGGTIWDDGIYGENTRSALAIFEREMSCPIKDGIVKPINTLYLSLNPDAPKLDLLNYTFAAPNGGYDDYMTRLDIMNNEANPKLFSAIYLGGK